MEWISVDKELPEPNVRVLVCTNWGRVHISSLQKTGWAGGHPVLYWMPLPSAPKSVKDKLLKEAGYTVRERKPFRRKDYEN